MSNRNIVEVSLKIKHDLRGSMYFGDYDFWTIVVPSIMAVGSNNIYDLMKIMANKAVSLLKGSNTKKKRVDIFINFESEMWEIVRVIGTVSPSEGGGIPSEDEVFAALASALIDKELNRTKVVIAALDVLGKEPGKLTITIDARLGSAVEKEVADALSGETVVLSLAEP